MRFDIKVKKYIKKKLVEESIIGKFEKIMMEMVSDAKRFAPVDTGRLRNSIHLIKKSPTHFEMRDGVHYGVYQEFGTYKMPAHPFFRPALNIAKAKIQTILKQ